MHNCVGSPSTQSAICLSLLLAHLGPDVVPTTPPQAKHDPALGLLHCLYTCLDFALPRLPCSLLFSCLYSKITSFKNLSGPPHLQPPTGLRTTGWSPLILIAPKHCKPYVELLHELVHAHLVPEYIGISQPIAVFFGRLGVCVGQV